LDSGSIPAALAVAEGVAPIAPRRVFVVAGMHRAGTSVVARGLQALGIDLGDRLMAADQRMNARGFFEDVDIVGLDDALLGAFGADWKNLALLDAVDWRAPALSTLRAEARQLLEARLARSGQFGFKDPRAPRLLPFWQGIFAEMGVADAYVIAVRHPLSVIASLTARDALDVRRSGWLWLTHLLCALQYTAGRPRVVVDYDRLLAAPERELARMVTGLGLPASALTGEDVAAYTRDFVSRELRHAEHGAEDLDAAAVAPLVRDAYALTQRLARDESGAGSQATAAEIGALFGRLAALSPLLSYAGANERAADEVPRLEGELAWARASVATATAFNENLQAATAAARTYNDDLVATLRRKEGELVAAHAELVAAHATLARIGKTVVGRIVLHRIKRQP
jgi:hypothetical protein